jgi:O-antigen ligase
MSSEFNQDQPKAFLLAAMMPVVALLTYGTFLAAFVLVRGRDTSDIVLVVAMAVFAAFWFVCVRPTVSRENLSAVLRPLAMPLIFLLYLLVSFLLLWLVGVQKRSVIADLRVLLQLTGFALFLFLVVRHLEREVFLMATGLLCAIAALASLVAFGQAHNIFEERMLFLGRNSNSNSGSASLIVGACALAGLAVAAIRQKRQTLLLLVLVVVIALCAVLSGARGTLVALATATIAVVLARRLSPSQLLLLALSGFLLQSGFVIFEDVIRTVACNDTQILCRESFRLEIWTKAIDLIAEKPLVGRGSLYRLPFPQREWFHPHNGILAIALAYGLPATVIFVILLGDAFLRGAKLASLPARMFCIAALTFTYVRMAVDTPMPLVIGRQYIYFLLPLVVTYAFVVKEHLWDPMDRKKTDMLVQPRLASVELPGAKDYTS